jgi:Family of unknown function (DUF5677)
VDAAAARLTKRLLRRRASILSARRQPLRGFGERLFERWKEALDLYELSLYLAGKSGDLYQKAFREFAGDQESKKFVALGRLHGIAILIAGEVLQLLKGGYASGAHARWRSLHETAVVTIFIARESDELAERFLDHRSVKAYEDAKEYQKHAKKLGEKEFSPDELEKLRETFDATLARYGQDFARSYGWAKRALEEANPKRKGHVTFGEIEKEVGVDFWISYYRMASHSVHPTATTINFNLGMPAHFGGILSGPSNAGLADPGHGALLSLANETAVLMTSVLELATNEKRASTDSSKIFESVSSAQLGTYGYDPALADLVNLAGDAFIQAHRQLESEEKQRLAEAAETSNE